MKPYLEKLFWIVSVYALIRLITPVSGNAMHIMEGFLPKEWALFWWIVFVPFFIYGFRNIKNKLALGKDIKLLIGLVAAFTFCLSALKLPSVVGSCSHPTGVGLGAILFGPSIMVVIGAVVLLLQALLLAHGGLTTLGANGFSMGVVGPFVAFGIYKAACQLGISKKWAVFLAAFMGDLMTYVMTSIQLGTAFPGSDGMWVSFIKYLSIFGMTQLPIAIAEGVLTVLVYNLLLEYKEQIKVEGLGELS